MTLYLDVQGPRGKLDQLLHGFGAVVLPGPPPGLDEVPPDKALVCVDWQDGVFVEPQGM